MDGGAAPDTDAATGTSHPAQVVELSAQLRYQLRGILPINAQRVTMTTASSNK